MQSCKASRREARVRCSTQTGYVAVDDTARLFYRRQRAASTRDVPVLVFVHGNDSDLRVWHCQQRYFCGRGFDTLAYDMRGYGRSSRDGSLHIDQHRADLRVLLEKRLILARPYVLVGWSTGGAVVLSYAHAYAQDAPPQRIVLVDTAPQFLRDDAFPYGRSLAQELELLGLITLDFARYATEGAQHAIPEQCSAAQRIRAQVHTLILESGRDTAFRQTSANMQFSIVAQLDTMHVPALVMVGALDGVLNPNCAMFMREHLPDAHLYEFPQAGHAPFLTYAREFNRRVHRFVRARSEPCSICWSLPVAAPITQPRGQ